MDSNERFFLLSFSWYRTNIFKNGYTISISLFAMTHTGGRASCHLPGDSRCRLTNKAVIILP